MDSNLSPLISAEHLTLFLPHRDVVFVDARGGQDSKDRFDASHLRGAVFMDLETDLSKKGPDAAIGGRHPLPDPETFGILLGKAGITPSTHVLVYDDKAGANAAARLWWMLRAAGHKLVQVIDGGLMAIQEAGLPMEEGAARPRRRGSHTLSGAGVFPLSISKRSIRPDPRKIVW